MTTEAYFPFTPINGWMQQNNIHFFTIIFISYRYILSFVIEKKKCNNHFHLFSFFFFICNFMWTNSYTWRQILVLPIIIWAIAWRVHWKKAIKKPTSISKHILLSYDVGGHHWKTQNHHKRTIKEECRTHKRTNRKITHRLHSIA